MTLTPLMKGKSGMRLLLLLLLSRGEIFLCEFGACVCVLKSACVCGCVCARMFWVRGWVGETCAVGGREGGRGGTSARHALVPDDGLAAAVDERKADDAADDRVRRRDGQLEVRRDQQPGRRRGQRAQHAVRKHVGV